MKITIESENLQKKLPLLNRCISSKNQLPILLTFLLEATGTNLEITATDLEIGIKVTIPAEIIEGGQVAVPAKVFSELINSLPSEKIELSTEENQLRVRSKKTKSSFSLTDASEFPNLYEDMGKQIAKLSNTSLKKDITSVVFATSPDITRPALSGVLLKKQHEEEKETFLFVATDGYRLSLRTHPLSVGDIPFEKPLLIPSRILREVLNAKEEEGTTALFVAEQNNQVIFKMKDTILVGRLIEAVFPPYEKIIPTDFSSDVTIDREELLKAVKICSIFARETANVVKISLQKDKVVVLAHTPSVGENAVEVEAKLKGEENEIAFNARYLLDLLSNVEGEDVLFQMSGPLNPGLFKIVGDDNFFHIIMPIRQVQA